MPRWTKVQFAAGLFLSKLIFGIGKLRLPAIEQGTGALGSMLIEDAH
jgi:hypothetical protein